MWDNVKIKDFGRVITGTTPSSKNPEQFGDECPFITPSDMGNSRTISAERGISENGATAHSRKLLPKESVCFVCIGATIGKICMTSMTSLTNQQINSIIVDRSNHDPFFLYYLLSTYSETVKSIAGGAATPIINKTSFENLEIIAPPLPIQQRIASILSAYDDLIENNTRRIQILQEMAQRIYKEWFVDFRFPGHEKTMFVDSELGRIPSGWAVKRLGDVVELVKAPTKPGEHLIDKPYVPIDCIGQKQLALLECKPWSEAKSSLIQFEENDILFGAMRPYFHKVCIAPFSGVTRTTCFVLRSRALEAYSFAVMTMFQDSTVEFANRHSKGATIPYASWDKSLENKNCLVPSSNILSKFEDMVRPFLEMVKGQFYRIKNLRQTRDLLLPKLISGEIDVSEMPDPKEAAAA